MVGLSRKVSVTNIRRVSKGPPASDHARALKDPFLNSSTQSLGPLEENDAEDNFDEPEAPEVPRWSEQQAVSAELSEPVAQPCFDEVDCGSCTVALRSPAEGLPGAARLEIRPRASAASPSPLDPVRLADALRRVVNFEVDFVMLLDFQERPPSPDLAQGLAEFCREAGEAWRLRLRAAALLIKDNILRSATRLPVCGFLSACPLACPLVLCRGEAAAAAFFRAGLRHDASGAAGASGSSFVALVDAQDCPAKAPPARAPGASCLAPAASCLARLAPMAHRDPSFSQAHTFHVLPNGDVRVIQSPSKDMVFAEHARTGHTTAGSNDKVAPLTAGSRTSLGADMGALGAIRFECSKEQLRHLLGAHLDIGELLADREAVPHRAAGPQAAATEGARGLPATCCARLHSGLRGFLAFARV